jgi:hypothetical protein
MGKELYEYKNFKKEYQTFALNGGLDSGPKPLMPYPEEILKSLREQE